VHVGENLTFLFENHETVRYQVLEMVRAERIVKESDIQHELDTYNELIGDSGTIGCTVLIEIPDAAERAEKLASFVGMPDKFYLKCEDGTKCFGVPDIRQNEDEKVSSVQFIMFKCASGKPVAVGVEHPALTVETVLSPEQAAALATDLV
jgi:hypothetical protein